MIDYPKIKTLFERDDDFNVDTTRLRHKSFSQVNYWLLTEKLDGTNIRLHHQKGRAANLYFKGRDDRSQMPCDFLEYLQDTFTQERIFQALDPDFRSFTIFGEGIGGRIQKTGPRYGQMRLVLFDVHVETPNGESLWLDYPDVASIASNLGLASAPIIAVDAEVPAIVNLVRDGFPSLEAEDHTFEAEGVVARTHPILLTRRGARLMWKLKTKDFRHGKKERQSQCKRGE